MNIRLGNFSGVWPAVMLALVCSAAALAQPGRAWSVRVDPVLSESVVQQRQVTGDLRAVRRSMVAAEEAGRVVELHIEDGDVIEEGQILARLDSRLVTLAIARLKAEITAFEATVGERDAAVDQALLDLRRLESARSMNAVSETEVENARISVRSAEARAAQARADVESARAALAEAEERLAKMTIRAPFAGSVVRKETEVGQWLGEGAAVAQIIQVDVVDAYIDVPETYIGAVSNGSGKVRVHITALDRDIEAAEIVVIPSGDTLARTFPVRIRLANEDGMLRPGMSIVAYVPTGNMENALTVHKDALLRDDGGAFVYANMDGQAMPIRVRRLWGFGDRVVVQSGMLQPGMQVVIEGNERLYPTAPLSVMNGEDTQHRVSRSDNPPTDQ